MTASHSIALMLARKLANFLAALGVAYVLATVTATQSVVARLGEMGVEIRFAERLAMTLSDLAGMAGMFLPLIAFGFIIAFLATALLCRWWDRWRLPLYIAAGACAVACIHIALNLAFEITPVAIARSLPGLLIQALAGAAGGFTYVSLMQREEH